VWAEAGGRRSDRVAPQGAEGANAPATHERLLVRQDAYWPGCASTHAPAHGRDARVRARAWKRPRTRRPDAPWNTPVTFARSTGASVGFNARRSAGDRRVSSLLAAAAPSLLSLLSALSAAGAGSSTSNSNRPSSNNSVKRRVRVACWPSAGASISPRAR
jgi:hypothetical protein